MSWLWECTTYVGELRRMTQYKIKQPKGKLSHQACSHLSSADGCRVILLYQTDEVPVGGSKAASGTGQRHFAIRVNNRFEVNRSSKVPEPYIPPKESRRGGVDYEPAESPGENVQIGGKIPGGLSLS